MVSRKATALAALAVLALILYFYLTNSLNKEAYPKCIHTEHFPSGIYQDSVGNTISIRGTSTNEESIKFESPKVLRITRASDGKLVLELGLRQGNGYGIFTLFNPSKRDPDTGEMREIAQPYSGIHNGKLILIIGETANYYYSLTSEVELKERDAYKDLISRYHVWELKSCS